ncbi:putative cytochrome P450 phenylacetate 2-hydroxylase [Trichoderma velutinum]
MELFILFVLCASVVAVIIRWADQTDVSFIKGLPHLRGVPIFGNLFLLGKHHARNSARLAKTVGDVFQVRLGNRRFIYVNSFETVKDFWIKNQSALISRPSFWTFHSVVSDSQAYTLGSSPWNESAKRTRKAAATALNRQAVQTYLPIIDMEAAVSFKELLDNVKKNNDMDPNGYFQRFALSVSLTLNYGLRLSDSIHDQTLNKVVSVEREMSNFRGIAHNWQDFVPFLRLWPGYKANAIKYRDLRDGYILSFYDQLKEKIANGTDNPCIAGSVLKDPEAKLSEREFKSICLSMVAAGLDTLPGNINMTTAYLSCPHGHEIQERAYEEIMKAYPDEDPWDACVTEEKCEYMQSFVKEVLRFWSTLNMCFPRTSIKDIAYKGATIPAGTTFLMNMWAANHDVNQFKSPMEFMPDRFMGIPTAGAGTQHYGYGAGTRMCAGSHLANRQLYVVFTRLILAFRIQETKSVKDRPILDTIDCNAVPTSMVTQPKPFKVMFVPRDLKKLERWISSSLERTAHLQV